MKAKKNQTLNSTKKCLAAKNWRKTKISLTASPISLAWAKDVNYL